LYAAFVLITWLSKVIIENITIMIFGSPKMSYYLVKYTSPTIIACAIFLFLFFENLKCGKTMIKFISFFAPISFGVYLIHAEPLLVDNFLTGKFVFLANLNPIVMMLALIGLGLAIWLICSLIDKLRLELFKLLKIKELSVKTENLIGKILRKIYEYAKALVVRNNQKA
ncbi:MAG: hypothetical protein KBS52_04855, partial [Clostridiales bacterium]|nr:hypothetical protein [Candidatus Equinaster intestinalis]